MFNPTALRKAKIVCNFGLSECNRVKTGNGKSRKAWNKQDNVHFAGYNLLPKPGMLPSDGANSLS